MDTFVKFRKPLFAEHLLYDIERFHEKEKREKLTIALRFIENEPRFDIVLSSADVIVLEFSNFIFGTDNVVRLR